MTHRKYSVEAFNTHRNIFCFIIMQPHYDKHNDSQKIFCGSFYHSQKYLLWNKHAENLGRALYSVKAFKKSHRQLKISTNTQSFFSAHRNIFCEINKQKI